MLKQQREKPKENYFNCNFEVIFAGGKIKINFHIEFK